MHLIITILQQAQVKMLRPNQLLHVTHDVSASPSSCLSRAFPAFILSLNFVQSCSANFNTSHQTQSNTYQLLQLY